MALTQKERAALPRGQFAIPERAPGPGSYPIPDEAHARDALARSSGKPEEERVRAAVAKKFPGIGKPKSERQAAAAFIQKRKK